MVYWSRKNEWEHGPAKKRMRQKMIKQTNSFLEWSLSNGHDLPRIPRRRVDKGGFGNLFRLPKGKKLAALWWDRVFKANWPD